MPVLSAVLYFLRDAVFCAALLTFARTALLFAGKNRPALWGLTGVLAAVNAGAVVYFSAQDAETARMVADLVSFALVVGGALSGLTSPRRALPAVIFTAVLADFTADTVYSLFSFAAADALWFESLFLLCVSAALLAGMLLLRKKGLSLLAGAVRTVPKWFFFALLFFEFTCYYREFGEAAVWYRWFYRVSVLAILFSLFWTAYKLVSFSSSRQEILSRLAAAEQYGETLLAGDEALRRFRHDYKNHLIVVEAYLSNGDAAAAAEYLKNAGAPALRQTDGSTGNFTADALLGVKRAEGLEKGIRIAFRGAVPAEGLRPEDLCTVLSNLLDNALEACAKCPAPTVVSVESVQTGGFVLLTVRNPLPPDAPAEGFATTKQNPKDHGLGLQNVRRALRRSGGALTLERENGTFIASARMKYEA